MQNKRKWLIVAVFSLFGLSYLCTAYIFYLKYSDAFSMISNYQIQNMESGITINKFMVISCLFVSFLIVSFICIFVNMLFKFEKYEKKVSELDSKINNIKLKKDDIEIKEKQSRLEKENIQKSLANYKKEYEKLDKYTSKINKVISNYKNEMTKIVSLLEKVKKQKNDQAQNINMFIKHSEDSIITTNQLYNELMYFCEKNTEFENLNLKASKLSEIANDIAINAAIENTKNKNSKQIGEGLTIVSDMSRILCEKSNTIFDDVKNWNGKLVSKTENIEKKVNKIKNIYVAQTNLSKKTENEANKLSKDLDESITKIDFIVDQINEIIKKAIRI